MLPGQPSRTLLRSAIRKAAHQLLDKPPIFSDPIVVGLVPEASEQTILATLDDPGAPDSKLFRFLFAIRSRFAEDRLTQAAARGMRQYVMVGAGLDTFPWRQPNFAKEMQIFAADHPASLAWTQERLREHVHAQESDLVPRRCSGFLCGLILIGGHEKAAGRDDGGQVNQRPLMRLDQPRMGGLVGRAQGQLHRFDRGNCLAKRHWARCIGCGGKTRHRTRVVIRPVKAGVVKQHAVHALNAPIAIKRLTGIQQFDPLRLWGFATTTATAARSANVWLKDVGGRQRVLRGLIASGRGWRFRWKFCHDVLSECLISQ